eukprot:3735503-Prorocentrum_lima.AAC.1
MPTACDQPPVSGSVASASLEHSLPSEWACAGPLSLRAATSWLKQMATVDAYQVGQARTMVLRHIPKRLQAAFGSLAANILEVWQLAERA